MLASRSPAVMIDPGESRCVTEPDSCALRGMIIFMASTCSSNEDGAERECVCERCTDNNLACVVLN